MFYEEPPGVCGQWKDYAAPKAAQPVPPHECKTDAEKLAYAAGWWKALEANRVQPVREPLTDEKISEIVEYLPENSDEQIQDDPVKFIHDFVRSIERAHGIVADK
jgi:hypothetical protein